MSYTEQLMMLRRHMADGLHVSFCPETERRFLCVDGKDDNIAEVFEWQGIPASVVASEIVFRCSIYKSLKADIERLEAERASLMEANDRVTTFLARVLNERYRTEAKHD